MKQFLTVTTIRRYSGFVWRWTGASAKLNGGKHRAIVMVVARQVGLEHVWMAGDGVQEWLSLNRR